MARAHLALCFSLVCQLWLIYVSISISDRDGEPQGDEGDASYLLKSPSFTTDCPDINRTNPGSTYGCQITLARFWAWYPDLKIEEDPFASLPEDDNMEMLNEVPLDDSRDPSSA
ncbi:hypothetical protein B296_00046745 [Ensete ventricosum]|uniref:Uncharacterized protein n=1 Tax=Ensete ventricosum TaxID=4639 RepID=A0A426Z2R0_ENSVE|nr:hypothetical protein B296_00046745 [Ensete ventricosum]